MSTNLPTYTLNASVVTSRESEVPAADFDGGVNKGGSNAPGIGINTGFVNPKLSDWSVLDQAEAARDPQLSMHIGGDGTFDGGLGVTIKAVQGADVNDTLAFGAADQQAVADAIYDTSSGALNKTGKTVEIGERLWGPIPAV